MKVVYRHHDLPCALAICNCIFRPGTSDLPAANAGAVAVDGAVTFGAVTLGWQVMLAVATSDLFQGPTRRVLHCRMCACTALFFASSVTSPVSAGAQASFV